MDEIQTEIEELSTDEREHIQNPYRLFTLTEYVDTVVAFLERLNPEIIIQRLAGEAPKHMLVAPNWGKRNTEVIKFITNALEEKDTWQGKFYQKRTIK